MLKREDFDAGPTSLDSIEKGLFLGNLTAATDKNVIEGNKINRILTVDSCPLPQKITDISGIKTLFIQVTDLPHEDLLGHFEEAYNFIKEAQDRDEIVLVHCYFGVSRSATIVIAFMMKKYSLTYSEALERVKSQRRFVGPNAGFQAQLELYERMGYTLDRSNAQYRMYRLKLAADKVKKVKILPLDCLDVIQPDPSLIRVSPDPLVYRCCRCRRIIASAANLMPHVPGERPSWKDPTWPQRVREQKICSATHFVEPLAWMKTVLNSEQGKLHCPKCNNKLGSFSWIMGCQCPCGSKISPAFYLVPSKVEWSNFVQNVQVTV
ncbi:dual specificity protein phosphatase MPK-4 [Macrosteles quadrilineatus]|uniref:dual specificity protein phosphatase MPK-4 n=1 Tax=Macrosteles quadrilineatus TaxID=74068 RepID=UPI0023E232D6|nr:dual specificity protein phosphatase MPK-4 [Macrosteles quadrilineatus]